MRIIVALLVLAGTAPALPAEPKIILTNQVELNVDNIAGPGRLSPDGKHVLYIKKETINSGKWIWYAYYQVCIDGTGDTKIFESAMDQYSPFMGCFGSGVFSPDGTRFLAVTTHNGKGTRTSDKAEKGKPVVVICDMTGKTIPLPIKTGSHRSAVFVNTHTVHYIASFSVPQEPVFTSEWQAHCEWRAFDIKTGKTRKIRTFKDAEIDSLTTSLDSKRIGGIITRKDEDSDRFSKALIAFDVQKEIFSESPTISTTVFFKSAFGPFWGNQDTVLFLSSMGINTGAPSTHTLDRFVPFEEGSLSPEEAAKIKKWVDALGDRDWKIRETAMARLGEMGAKVRPALQEAAKSEDLEQAKRINKLLAKMKCTTQPDYMSLCEFAPGLLSGGLFSTEKKTYRPQALQAKTNKIIPLDSSLLLIDRRGNTGLFRDLKWNTYWTAKIEIKWDAKKPAVEAPPKKSN